jgi:hypothetical protein
MCNEKDQNQNGTQLRGIRSQKKKTVEQFFKKCCITNALDGTEDDVLWKHSGLAPPPSDLKNDIWESVDLKCETGCTIAEDSGQINLFTLNFHFDVGCVC